MNHAQPDGSRQAPASSIRRVLPAPSVAGFVLLLIVLFAGSYLVGTVSGPVAPGMRPIHGDSGVPTTDEHGGTGGTHGMRAPSPGEVTR